MRKPHSVVGRFVFLKNRVPSTRAWAAPLLFFIALASSAAHADDKAKAAAHYKQGKAFFEAKQYAQAIGEYKAAYALDKLPAHLFNIARAYHLSGELDLAIEHYQKFVDADPKSPNAATARTEIVAATKARDERKADQAAKQQQDELAKKRAIALGHVKQAKAYEQAGAWASAAEEYVAAGEHEPDQLLAAVDAYRKVPDLTKARFAYITYLDRVPNGPRSDQVRKDLATITKELEVAALPIKAPDTPPVDKPKPEVVEPVRLGLTRMGFRIAGAVTQGTENPVKVFEGADGSDGQVAGFGIELGMFLRYQLAEKFAIRPEVVFSTRTSAYDGQMIQEAVEIHRTGGSFAALAMISANSRVQVGFGVELGLMVKSDATVNMAASTPDISEFNTFEAAMLGALVFDLGRGAIELRYRRTLTDVSELFPTKLQSVSAGFSVAFDL
jgi:tetratricopeptide (TPR) repeat protein